MDIGVEIGVSSGVIGNILGGWEFRVYSSFVPQKFSWGFFEFQSFSGGMRVGGFRFFLVAETLKS